MGCVTQPSCGGRTALSSSATDLIRTDFSQLNQFIHVDLDGPDQLHRVPPAETEHAAKPHLGARGVLGSGRGQYGIIYSINNGTRDVFFVNSTPPTSRRSARRKCLTPDSTCWMRRSSAKAA